MLPESFVPSNLAPDGHIRWTLGDGSQVEAPFLSGMVRIRGFLTDVPVLITVLGNEFLIGSALLRRYRVILDPGARVIFEP
jgi:hypothetical protein